MQRWAMNKKNVVMICCVCGRDRTDSGWQYSERKPALGEVLSHGFCDHCYEMEMMKMRWESRMSELAAAT